MGNIDTPVDLSRVTLREKKQVNQNVDASVSYVNSFFNEYLLRARDIHPVKLQASGREFLDGPPPFADAAIVVVVVVVVRRQIAEATRSDGDGEQAVVPPPDATAKVGEAVHRIPLLPRPASSSTPHPPRRVVENVQCAFQPTARHVVYPYHTLVVTTHEHPPSFVVELELQPLIRGIVPTPARVRPQAAARLLPTSAATASGGTAVATVRRRRVQPGQGPDVPREDGIRVPRRAEEDVGIRRRRRGPR